MLRVKSAASVTQSRATRPQTALNLQVHGITYEVPSSLKSKRERERHQTMTTQASNTRENSYKRPVSTKWASQETKLNTLVTKTTQTEPEFTFGNSGESRTKNKENQVVFQSTDSDFLAFQTGKTTQKSHLRDLRSNEEQRPIINTKYLRSAGPRRPKTAKSLIVRTEDNLSSVPKGSQDSMISFLRTSPAVNSKFGPARSHLSLKFNILKNKIPGIGLLKSSEVQASLNSLGNKVLFPQTTIQRIQKQAEKEFVLKTSKSHPNDMNYFKKNEREMAGTGSFGSPEEMAEEYLAAKQFIKGNNEAYLSYGLGKSQLLTIGGRNEQDELWAKKIFEELDQVEKMKQKKSENNQKKFVVDNRFISTKFDHWLRKPISQCDGDREKLENFFLNDWVNSMIAKKRGLDYQYLDKRKQIIQKMSKEMKRKSEIREQYYKLRENGGSIRKSELQEYAENVLGTHGKSKDGSKFGNDHETIGIAAVVHGPDDVIGSPQRAENKPRTKGNGSPSPQSYRMLQKAQTGKGGLDEVEESGKFFPKKMTTIKEENVKLDVQMVERIQREQNQRALRQEIAEYNKQFATKQLDYNQVLRDDKSKVFELIPYEKPDIYQTIPGHDRTLKIKNNKIGVADGPRDHMEWGREQIELKAESERRQKEVEKSLKIEERNLILQMKNPFDDFKQEKFNLRKSGKETERDKAEIGSKRYKIFKALQELLRTLSECGVDMTDVFPNTPFRFRATENKRRPVFWEFYVWVSIFWEENSI